MVAYAASTLSLALALSPTDTQVKTSVTMRPAARTVSTPKITAGCASFEALLDGRRRKTAAAIDAARGRSPIAGTTLRLTTPCAKQRGNAGTKERIVARRRFRGPDQSCSAAMMGLCSVG